MSRGMGAFAYKKFEDDATIIYEYGSYNLNDSCHINGEHMRA